MFLGSRTTGFCSYHDEEWGSLERDGRRLWEMLMLEGFQAGLSLTIILRKRGGLFAGRSETSIPEWPRVARYGEADVVRLLGDQGIVRSRAKIEATIAGARIFMEMQASGEDFSDVVVWKMAGGRPIQNTGQVPASTPLSGELSRVLKKRGFKFVGPVIVYAWMQAVGITNDHSPDCFRRNEVQR